MRDESGTEHPRTNGFFALSTSLGTRKIPVINGRWELEVTAGQTVNFMIYHKVEMRTDGRIGELSGGYAPFTRYLPLEGDTELALTGEWLARHQLVVLDAETREHLDRLLVVERFALSNRFAHPGPIEEKDVIYRDAASPLIIDPLKSFRELYFIGREGYRWSRIVVDHEKGGRHEVLLQRGAGDLEIAFRGHMGPTEIHIHAAGEKTGDTVLETDSNESLVLANLAPGRYVLEARGSIRSGIVRKEVDVAPGPNRVELEIPRVYEDSVPISGTVAFERPEDARFGGIDFQRVFRPSMLSFDTPRIETLPTDNATVRIADMKRAPDGWRFDSVQLGAGTYRVSVWSPDSFFEQIWTTSIAIGPGESGPFRSGASDGRRASATTSGSPSVRRRRRSAAASNGSGR